jgi:adenine-specific DNA-methyltransferase
VSETRKQSKRFKALQQDEKRYYRAKMDLCDAFVMWSVEHLTGHGQLALVLPEYWTQRSSSYALRTQLWQQGQLQEFWRFGADKVFKNAPGHHPSLLIWRKKPSHSVERTQRVSMGVVTNTATLSAEQLQSVVFTLDESSGKLLYGNPVELALLQKLACLPPLLNAQEIQQGIVIPQGRLKKADAQRLSAHLQEPVYENAGVFLLDEEKIHQLGLTDAERQLLKPYYFPAGFRLFQGFQEVQAQVYIIYTDRENKKLIETYPQHYPSLRAHLDYYRAINTSAFAPYGLHRPRQPQWFEDERKILCPRQVRVPAFAVVSFTAYVNEGFYSIRPACEDPHYLCALFNSKLAWFWFYHHKRKGNRLQIDKEVLSVFPRPPQQPGMDLDAAKQLAIELSQHFDRDKWQCLNELIYQLYKLEPVEIDWIENAWQTIAGAE